MASIHVWSGIEGGTDERSCVAIASASGAMFAPLFSGFVSSVCGSVPLGWTEKTNSNVARTPRFLSGIRTSTSVIFFLSHSGTASGFRSPLRAWTRVHVPALKGVRWMCGRRSYDVELTRQQGPGTRHAPSQSHPTTSSTKGQKRRGHFQGGTSRGSPEAKAPAAEGHRFALAKPLRRWFPSKLSSHITCIFTIEANWPRWLARIVAVSCRGLWSCCWLTMPKPIP